MKIIYSNSTCIIKNRMDRYTTFSNSCCNLYCETSLNCYCILITKLLKSSIVICYKSHTCTETSHMTYRSSISVHQCGPPALQHHPKLYATTLLNSLTYLTYYYPPMATNQHFGNFKPYQFPSAV